MTDSSEAGRDGPLTGLRILDLTAVVLGPIATQYLADYGAEVIKVEPPEGDLMRSNGVSLHAGMSSIFLAVNRNKRSVVLDLKSPDAITVLHRLVSTVDVFIHNMRPAAIERLGLGYQSLAALNPRLVYCAAPGFGQDGPHRDKPAFDDIIQAASGLVGLNALGRDGPAYVPSLIADKTAGLCVLNAVLAAVVHQSRHGRGQYVEVPMLESMVQFVLAEHLGGLTFRPAPKPAGYHRLLQGGREPARTADGWMALLPYTEKHWIGFFEAVGRHDLVQRYPLANRHERNGHVQALYAHVREITPLKTTAEWMALCERLDIPATPIYALDDLPSHPHLQAVQMFVDQEHPTEGPMRAVRPAAKFSATPATLRRPAPTLGQHTREVMREAGYDDGAIEALASTGAFGPRRP